MAEFLSLYVFSRIYNTPGWLVIASLLFSWRWHYSSSLWFPPCQWTLAGMPSVLAPCLPELWLLPSGVLTGSQLQSKRRCCLTYGTLWAYTPLLICSLPSVMEPSQQGSECCNRERSLFSSIPHRWGSQTFTHWLSLSPAGEVMGCAISGVVWCWQSQVVPLTHSNEFKPFLLQWNAFFLQWKPELSQRLSCSYVIPQVSVLQALPYHSQEELEVVHSLL